MLVIKHGAARWLSAGSLVAACMQGNVRLGLPGVIAWSGCAVQLVGELRKHGLTLVNYASIREQSIGGFIQVCCPQ